MCAKFWLKSLKGEDHSEDPGTGGAAFVVQNRGAIEQFITNQQFDPYHYDTLSAVHIASINALPSIILDLKIKYI
jgi:hypothetical protein